MNDSSKKTCVKSCMKMRVIAYQVAVFISKVLFKAKIQLVFLYRLVVIMAKLLTILNLQKKYFFNTTPHGFFVHTLNFQLYSLFFSPKTLIKDWKIFLLGHFSEKRLWVSVFVRFFSLLQKLWTFLDLHLRVFTPTFFKMSGFSSFC